MPFTRKSVSLLDMILSVAIASSSVGISCVVDVAFFVVVEVGSGPTVGGLVPELEDVVETTVIACLDVSVTAVSTEFTRIENS